MKKIFVSLGLMLFTAGLFAVPAKPGMWKILRLSDGKEVSAQLLGDEFMHYYQSENGVYYVSDNKGSFSVVDKATLISYAKSLHSVRNKISRRSSRNLVGGIGTVFEGHKKGLIILVEFSDKNFKSDHDLDFYKRLANEPGFTTDDGFNGSVRDYFKDQSMGVFDVEFDVVGPIKMSKPYSYYGQNVGLGGDAHAGEMVAEACTAIEDMVDFADYDWDGDGEVEQVFVLYSGLGEAAGGSSNTIWPHKWTLFDSDYGKALTLDGVTIDTYACSCEMTLDNENDFKEVVDGIGTICHEFSHCLGYPDVYDTTQSITGVLNFGMNMWDLMDYGSYNNGGYTPSGYTAYEKWMAGWITPVELTSDIEINNLKPLSLGGNAYIIYNSGNKDEFIIFENRQQVGWDAAQPSSGLIAMHIDYDAEIWDTNTVNNQEERQRYTIFHADNSDGTSIDDLAGDLYPYGDNNCLNSISLPKPLWYSANADGYKRLGMSVYDITLNNDGTVSFKFSSLPFEEEAYVLFETFDENIGDGGNDGSWTATGGKTLITDIDGWTGVKSYAGAQCARFGTKTVPGSLTSPEFEVENGAELTCLAGPWSGESCTMKVSFINSQTGEESVLGNFDIVESKWTECRMNIPFKGKGRLKFESSTRQFLDEVRVTKSGSSGIINNDMDEIKYSDTRVYSIDGRYLGDDIDNLENGIYIVGGNKIVK